MASNHIVDIDDGDWNLCLTGSSVSASPASVGSSQRRASTQSRGEHSARSQYSLVSIAELVMYG